jgi:hypothetical protein
MLAVLESSGQVVAIPLKVADILSGGDTDAAGEIEGSLDYDDLELANAMS